MTSVFRRTASVVAICLLTGTLTQSAQGLGKWLTGTKFAPLPEPAEEYWSATANGKFYLFGGTPVRTGAKSVLPGRVLEYDPAADKWTAKTPMPHPSDHMAVAEYRGKLYLFGGVSSEQPGGVGPNVVQLDDAWEYDPATDAWKGLAPMPTRRSAAAAIESGGKIYVIGGSGLGPGAKGNAPPPEDMLVLGTNEVYDPATNKWETRRAMPTARNHSAIGAIGGKVYVIGGRIGSANVANLLAAATDVNEAYDPATDRWKVLPKMPTARSGHGWATYQGRIYVVGGELRDYHMDAIFRDVEAFDPAANEWSRLVPLATARHGVNVGVLGNRLHVIGGHVAFNGTGEHDADTGIQEVFEFGK